MALSSGKYWTGDLSIKPDAWGPFEDVQSALFHNADRMGIDPADNSYPTWEKAGNILHDYGTLGYDATASSSFLWDANTITPQLATAKISSCFLTKFSLRFRIKSLSYSNGKYNIIYHYYAGNRIYFYISHSSGYLKFEYTLGSSSTIIQTYSTVAALQGKYLNVILTADGATAKLYVDGNTVGSDYPYTGLNALSSHFSVMKDTSSVYKFDSAEIYPYVLNPSQIALLSDHPYGLLQPIIRRSYSLPTGDIIGSNINCTTSDISVQSVKADILKVATIDCITGDISAQGIKASVINERTFNCATGIIITQGVKADISKTTNIQSKTSTVIVSGIQAEITNENAIYCTTSNISVQGVKASISKGLTFQATTGEVVISAVKAEAVNEKTVNCTTGTIISQGVEATITRTNIINCTTGIVLVLGVAAYIRTDTSGGDQVTYMALSNAKELKLETGQIATLITE